MHRKIGFKFFIYQLFRAIILTQTIKEQKLLPSPKEVPRQIVTTKRIRHRFKTMLRRFSESRTLLTDMPVIREISSCNINISAAF